MTLLNRVADWLIARAKRTPYSHLPGYMFRWWLLPYSCWRPSVRVHEIIASDDDRAFHDHPWWYFSIILRGGYWEVRPCYDASDLYEGDVRTWYGPGSVIFRRAASWHRLEIPNGSTCTTLFTTGRYARRWGFMPTPAYKIEHSKYPKVTYG